MEDKEGPIPKGIQTGKGEGRLQRPETSYLGVVDLSGFTNNPLGQ